MRVVVTITLDWTAYWFFSLRPNLSNGRVLPCWEKYSNIRQLRHSLDNGDRCVFLFLRTYSDLSGAFCQSLPSSCSGPGRECLLEQTCILATCWRRSTLTALLIILSWHVRSIISFWFFFDCIHFLFSNNSWKYRCADQKSSTCWVCLWISQLTVGYNSPSIPTYFVGSFFGILPACRSLDWHGYQISKDNALSFSLSNGSSCSSRSSGGCLPSGNGRRDSISLWCIDDRLCITVS